MKSITPVSPEHIDAWKRFRDELFGKIDTEITDFDIKRITESPDQQCFIALESNEAIGFAEVVLRNLVDGCRTTPVAYLEAIYVSPRHGGQGVGRNLCDPCEQWAISKGCSEFATDTGIEDEDSQRFHRHMGFAETY